MAIQPIDLQTLYTQLENVSKTVAFQQQGVHIKEALQQSREVKAKDEKKKTVSEAEFADSGSEAVKNDRHSSGSGESPESKNKKSSEQEEESPEPEYIVFKDPGLGKIIDING